MSQTDYIEFEFPQKSNPAKMHQYIAFSSPVPIPSGVWFNTSADVVIIEIERCEGIMLTR